MTKNSVANPFITLGVSADAEMALIQSVGKRRLMTMRLEDDPDSRMVARIEDALEQLADPVVRFEEGLFALELRDDEAEYFRQDPVLSTLAVEPNQDGLAAYERICKAENPTILAHNRGILRFIQAVAATEEAQQGTPDDISDDLDCIGLWRDAYKNLQLAFGSEKFWSRHKLRAKCYEDKRLGPDRVQQVREEIYSRVVSPVGHVITRALLDRHATVAGAYVELLRSSGFESSFVEAVLSGVYKPLADRVEERVETLKDEFEQLDAGSEDTYGLKRILDRFEFDVVPDLDVMLEVGDLPGYAEEHARDKAAELVRAVSLTSWNRAQDVALAKRASGWAAKYVDSVSLQSKIEEDAEFLKTAKPLDERAAELRAFALAAIQTGDNELAIRGLEDLLSYLKGMDGSNREEILQVRSALATALFNRAMEIAAPENTGEMRGLLKRSLELEPDEEDRALIRRALNQVPTGGQKVAREAGNLVVGLVIQVVGLGVGLLLCGLLAFGLSQCR